MKYQRNYGLDMFRILCCIGVLIYHIMDDVLGKPGGGGSKAIYFAASFCVPGFFLLSGYLLGIKRELSIEYIEVKVCQIIKKLFGWIIFWSVVHYLRTEEIYNLWDNMTAGISGRGILPVAWFLFTYCFLMVLGYPLWHLMKKYKHMFCILSMTWIVLLAFGIGKITVDTRTQSLWLHLYVGYFCLGMALSEIIKWFTCILNTKICICAVTILGIWGLSVHAYTVKNAVIYLAPHSYYGKWFYSLWLISMFWICSMIQIKKEKIQSVLKMLSDNTFVVYLGHLPILLYITNINPLETTTMALIFILSFFAGLEILAELLKRLPLLRKLV